MKNLKEKLFFLSFVMFSLLLTAQGIKVKGTVLDAEDQSPLIGASVLVEGTSKGAATDFDGGYTITDNPGDVLIFSYLGYEDLKITVGQSSVINASLKIQADALNEVVVVAYGTTTKRNITGAQATIKSESFRDRPVVTIDDALQGNATGLLVQSSSGQPGAAANINIRGIGTLSGSAQPLVVIDGFPIDQISTSSGFGLDAGGGQMSPFAFINPNDVESVEVLKDASATALYGVRGANGVILITTKKGSVGNTKISYNSFTGIRNVREQLDVMSFDQYRTYVQERVPTFALFSDVTTTPATPYDFEPTAPSVNWQDRIFRTGIVQSHSLSVQGGADNTRYILSGSYLQDKSIIIATDFKKYDLRLNIDQKVSEKLKFGATLSYNYIANEGVPTDGREGTAAGTVMSALIARPYILADTDTQAYFRRAGVPQVLISNFAGIGGDARGPENVARNSDIDKNISRFMGNGWALWDFNKNLSLKIYAGSDMFYGKNQEFYPTNTPQGFLTQGMAVVTSYLNRSFLNDNVITYNTKFGSNHKLEVLVGNSIQESRFEWIRAENSTFENESLGYNQVANASLFRNSSQVSMSKLIGFIGRANYNFKNKFNLTVSGRYDGSSRFLNDRWQFFPSAAVGYNLADENFLKESRVVSLLKIRGSLGQVGNSNVPSTGAYSQLYRTNYTFNDEEVLGQSPANLANEALSWETTQQVNGGVDLNLFNNQISITADYYVKTTKDLLLNTPITNVSGFDSAWKNVGELKNSGIEFSISSTNLKTDNFEWRTSFNITTNQTEIVKLGESGEPIYVDVNFSQTINDEIILQEGGEIGALYGYVQDGIYLPSDYVDGVSGALSSGVATRGLNEQPGEIKFKDLNGDGIVDGDDRAVIGNTMPDFFGSLTNDFVYKNFDLNIILQYSIGNDVFNATRTRTELFQGQEAQSPKYFERWTTSNPTSTQYSTFGSMVPASTFVEDASFLRIRNIRLGYNLPKDLYSKLKIKNIKIYGSADNVAVFTKYSGYDPEISSNVSSGRYSASIQNGFDYGGFPRPRTFTFGLNVDF